MRRLKKLGFVQVGHCVLDSSLHSGVRYVTEKYSSERVVYAFMVNAHTQYIGVCDNSNTTLRTRMNRYQGMVGAGTNRRITTQIKKLLKQQNVVTIWALLPKDAPRWSGLPVDLVKGLENPIIKRIGPEWNIKG